MPAIAKAGGDVHLDAEDRHTIDPIFSAIKRHKAAMDRFDIALRALVALEELQPAERYDSRSIVPTADPQLIGAGRNAVAAMKAAQVLGAVVLKAEPTTPRGAAAVRQYMAHHVKRYGAPVGFPNTQWFNE